MTTQPLSALTMLLSRHTRRREFITLIGSAASTWAIAARAQQSAPLVGFLNSASPDTYRFNADSFREGLAKAGFIEGRNLRIEERWARGDYEVLPALAAELVAAGVVAIAATGDVASARAAQRASGTVPVVFTIGGDPVRFGLVQSVNRPGGHVTGILFNPNVLSAKRVELLREIAPSAGSHCSPPRARRRRSPTSSTPPLWKPWAIRMCARGLPILDRKSRLVITRRRRHSVLSTRPKSRNGGRSSRRQTSRRNERVPQRSFSSRVAPTA
jgi:ABC transporter substrate binding protein